jgi:tetrahydromethanopterin S-methyltransferase subunit G
VEQILSNLNSLTGKNNMTNTAKEMELRLDSIDERLALSNEQLAVINNIVKEMEFRLDSIEERLTPEKVH